MNLPDTARHLRERVAHERSRELAAFERWLASADLAHGEREGLWASWIVARSALDRAVSSLRAELADRERLGVKP